MSDLFKKYYNKILKERLLISILKSISISLAVLCLLGIIKYFFNFSSIILIAGPIVSFIIIFLLAFKKPTVREVAKRLDELGLEERLITAEQFKDDNSFIAIKQREDAEKALNNFNSVLLKLVIPVSCIILSLLTFISSTGVITVLALADTGIIKSGQEIIKELGEEDPIFYEVNYDFTEGGVIEGNIFQLIQRGEDSEAVFAIADDGYVFTGWSDGFKDPYRKDIEIYENITITAQFEIVETEDEELLDEDQAIGEPGNLEDENQSQGKEPSTDPGTSEGGQWKANDSINNGADDYGDFYNGARGDAQDESSRLDRNQQDVISGYFNGIVKGKN